MATLILPCAGKSTRFKNTRPKWSLTHPYGELMLIQGIKGLELDKYEKIIPVFLKEHLDDFKLRKGVIESFDKLGINYEILELDAPTKSQSETVAKTIETFNIKGDILIKDCDDYFNCDYIEGNTVCVCSLHEVNKIIAKNKSYVQVNSNNLVETIVEKSVISDLFCCGGYNFKDAQEFLNTYNKVSKLDTEGEIYISHIIYQQLLEGKNFTVKQVSDYEDWGTIEDWNEYLNTYKTIFIDLDGVLVESSGEYFGHKWGTTEALANNVNHINELYDTGRVRIIITTSRKSSYKEQTLNQLDRLGIKYHNIMFDLLHCKRILINDFASSNSFPTSTGINIPRNNDNLKEYFQ